MTPNTEQLAIIASRDPRIVVIAGAGSGKTATLVWRILHDITLKKVPPERMVAITFTTIAAAELQRRLDVHNIRLGFIGTLHAYALWNLGQYGFHLRYSGTPTVMDEESSTAAWKRVLAEQRVNLPLKTVKSYLGVKGTGAGHLVAKAFLLHMRAINAVDYDTMLAEFLALIKGGLIKVAALYVDEYQDSAEIDSRIYEALAAPMDIRLGDVDQSMYSFRGGSISHILAAARTATIFHLTSNYRSKPLIVAAANKLIAGGYDNPYRKPMVAARGGDGTISVTAFPNAIAEATAIASFISTGGGSPADYAVLTRFTARADLIRDVLIQSGLNCTAPKKVVKPVRVIAALRAIAHQGEAAAAAWIASVNAPGLDAEARSRGQDRCTTLLARLGVQPQQQLGEKLQRMQLTAEEIRLVRDSWTGDAAMTATALELDDPSEGNDIAVLAVHVGTIHSFKGGERPTIFLAGWEDETLPATKTGDSLSEELRIAYVALTRAQDNVRISWCQTAPDSQGRTTFNAHPSRFIPSL